MYSGVVYLYISPEDKVYVGVTINERQRRSCWFRAGDYAGFRIAAARRKYPPELWEYRVLSRVSLDSLDALLLELSRLESYFIKEFRSSNPAFGYNVLSGGVGFSWASASVADRQALGKLRAKAVWQFSYAGELVAEFDSAVTAAKATGSHHSSICRCCRGARKAHNGSLWRWAGEYAKPLSADDIHVIESNTPVAVSKYDVKGVFICSYSSIGIASRVSGVGIGCISMCCRGLSKTAGGFQWRRDDLSIPLDILPDSKASPRVVCPISQYTLDGVFVASFLNISKASLAVGVNSGSIWHCLTKSRGMVQSGGFIWAFSDESDSEIMARVLSVRTRHSAGSSKPVNVYNSDGSLFRSFPSCKLASRFLGCRVSSVLSALDRGTMCCGYFLRSAS